MLAHIKLFEPAKTRSKRIGSVFLVVVLLVPGLIWFKTLGWLFAFFSLYPCLAYSSLSRRDNRPPGVAEDIDEKSREVGTVIAAILKPYKIVYSAFEVVVNSPLSVVLFSLFFGFLSPLSVYAYAKHSGRRPSRITSAVFLILSLIGTVWGINWAIRIGWFLVVITLPFFLLISSYWRRRPPVPTIPITLLEERPIELLRPLPLAKIVYFLLLLNSALLVTNWLRDPSIMNVDNTYHVLISKMISERGFFLWDDVQFAPAGRPHLYPPLFHAIVAVSAKALGGSPDAFVLANDVVSAAVYILGMYVTWHVARKLHGDLGGFLTFVMVSGLFMPAFALAIGLPSALVFVFTPVAVLWMLEGRGFRSFLACVASLYSHASGVVITPVAMLVAGALGRRFKPSLKITVASALAYVPWLLRFLIFRGWFQVPERDIQMTFSWALLPLTVVGTFLALRRAGRFPLHLGFLASIVPIFFAYPGRAILQGSYAFALAATIGLTKLFARIPPRHRRKATAGFLLFFYTFPLFLSFPVMQVLMLVTPAGMDGQYSWVTAREIGAALVPEVEPGEIIHCQDPPMGCAIAVYAPVRLDAGIWGEVAPEDTGARMGENVNTLVVRRWAAGVVSEELTPLIESVGWTSGFSIIVLRPENLRPEMLPLLMSEAALRGREASKSLKENSTAAAESLTSLELSLLGLALSYKDIDLDVAIALHQAAQMAGFVATALAVEWGSMLLDEETLGQVKEGFDNLATLAEAGDLAPLAEWA